MSGHFPRPFLFVLIGCLIASNSEGRDFVVKTLDSEHHGELTQIQEGQLVLRDEDDLLRIPLMDILHVRCVSPTIQKPKPEKTIGVVRLADGSRVPHEDWHLAGETLHLRLPCGDGVAQLVTSTRALRSWRLPGSCSAEVLQQWQQVLQSVPTSDLLLVRRRATGTFEPIEGVIEHLDSEAVRFLVEGESEGVDVPWRRLFGLVFFAPNADSPSARGKPVLRTLGEGQILVADLVADSHGLHATTPAGALLEAPLSLLRAIDFSAGKVFYLGDLPLIKAIWNPTSSHPSGIDFTPRMDRALDASPLRLRLPDARAPNVWRTQTFVRGVALRSGSTLTVQLPKEARWLRGQVGIDPATHASGSVELVLSVDDEAFYRLAITGQSPPVALDLSLPTETTNSRQLKIRVKPGDNFDTGDNLHFVDARVTR